MSEVKGLHADIMKHRGNAFDGKSDFSSKYDDVTVLASEDFPNIPGIFEPAPDRPAVKIVKRKVMGREYLTAYPADKDPSKHYMFGGTFIYDCDSRFPADYPIPLHDRTEW